MAVNSMRYKIVFNGTISDRGWCGMLDEHCEIGRIVSPFNQDYLYKIVHLYGYDVTLEPYSESAIRIHTEMKER